MADQNEVTLRTYIETRLQGERELVMARFASMETAIQKATEVQEIRNETFNNVRKQIEEERQTYVRRDWLEGQLQFLGVLITSASGIVMFLINLWMK